MKMLLSVALLSTVLTSAAFAGINNATLKCASASGKTTLSGWVPGDMQEAYLTLTLDAKNPTLAMSKTLANPEMLEEGSLNQGADLSKATRADIHVTANSKLKVFTISAKESMQYPSLVLIANPATFTSKMGKFGSETRTFKALLTAADFRTNAKEGYLSDIELACVYSYSL